MYPAQASPMDLTITARDERGRTKDAIGEIETRWDAPIGSEDGAADVMSAGRIRKGKPAVSRMIDDTRLIRAITDMVVPLTPAISGGPGGAPLARHRAERCSHGNQQGA